MARILIKIRDLYFEWSSIVDAPVTYGMTEEQLRAYIKDKYGSDGLESLPDRLRLIEERGVTSYMYPNVERFLAHNQAGPNETTLTVDEIYAHYAHPPKETNP